jgi:hypothetical protein
MADVKSRTIDSLGVDAYNQYAKNEQFRDSSLIQDSKQIRTEIAVVKPYKANDFDAHFTFGRVVLWAIFPQPPMDLAFTTTLFSYQLIPSLGGTEKQLALTDKISAMDESPERNTILAMLECINGLDRDLTIINNNRNRWQRG